jgi:hypothetical protein
MMMVTGPCELDGQLSLVGITDREYITHLIRQRDVHPICCVSRERFL